MKRLTYLVTALLFINLLFEQQAKKGKYGDGPDDIPMVGVIKGLSDEQLLEETWFLKSMDKKLKGC